MTPRHRCVLIICVIFAGVGCTTFSGQSSGGQVEGRSTSDFTEEDLHRELLNYVGQFEATIRSTSGDIARRAENREHRRRALLWKVNLIPLAHELVTKAEKKEAYFALALLTEIMKQYLTTGTGQDVFGPQQKLAVDAADQLEGEILSIGNKFLPEARVRKFRNQVREYAKEHKIRGSNFSVESFQSFIQKVKKQRDIFTKIVNVPLSPFSALQGVGSTPAAVHDVSASIRDMTAVVEDLPQQVRWHTELLLYDIENRDAIQRTLQEIEQFNHTASRLEKTLKSWPSDVKKILKDTSPHVKNLQSIVEKSNRLVGEIQNLVGQVDQVGTKWKPLFEQEEGTKPASKGEEFRIKDYRSTIREANQTVQNLQKLTKDLQSLIESEGVDSSSNQLTSLGKQAEQSSEDVINLAFLRGLQLIAVFFIGLLLYRTVVYLLFEPSSGEASG